MHKAHPTLLLGYTLLALTLSAARPVQADTVFSVDTSADLLDDDIGDGLCHTSANTCSLRAAIMQANHLTVPVTRIQVPAGTYVLVRPPSGVDGDDNGDLNLTAQLNVNQSIVVNGAGAANTIIDGNQSDRVFRVHENRTATLAGLTIRNGRAFQGQGGGIVVEGTLTVADCVIENNQTNSAGGGIYNTSIVNVVRTTVRSNIAYLGGGLYSRGEGAIRNSTFYGNGATGAGGGAYVSSFDAATLYVVNSTFSRNYANGNGGGIDSEGSTFLYNTTIVDNDADHDRDEFGGIGGGVLVNPGSRFVVVNSLIAINTMLDAPIYNDCSGTLEAYGRNYFYDLAGCTLPNAGASGLITPGTIGALQDNGGPTWTHALLPGSQAIDGTLTGLGCVDENGTQLPSDQRGAARIAGARCDAGAFESGAAADRIFRNGFD